jgi:hypothetical protein
MGSSVGSPIDEYEAAATQLLSRLDRCRTKPTFVARVLQTYPQSGDELIDGWWELFTAYWCAANGSADTSGRAKVKPRRRMTNALAAPESSPREPRLYFIVARDAPLAVVFRRGPTKQVELLTWDLRSDELTPGQWLKGRIYERRCDLSPKGDLLVYFAAKWEAHEITEGSWTAVSRPPYLTALALWFNGDMIFGGGLFDSDQQLRLDVGSGRPSGDFKLPPWMQVNLLDDQVPHGLHDPIEDIRLRRDGWQRVGDRGPRPLRSLGEPAGPGWAHPLPYRRSVGPKDSRMTLELAPDVVRKAGRTKYVARYRVLHDGREVRSIGPADWADTGPNGDLLLARDGRLFRLSGDSPSSLQDGELHEVADLRGHRFEERIAPAEARRW